jgi:hypothetical protein
VQGAGVRNPSAHRTARVDVKRTSRVTTANVLLHERHDGIASARLASPLSKRCEFPALFPHMDIREERHLSHAAAGARTATNCLRDRLSRYDLRLHGFVAVVLSHAIGREMRASGQFDKQL